jgi:20S proteasome alpha/beta subunit
MTLIAALPCQDGTVICADSLEAAGDYKVSVDKVRPIEVGAWTCVFGGAGNDGGLIDGLDDKVQKAIKKASGGRDIAEVIRKAVASFYRNEVALHPGLPDEKHIEAVLCLKPKDEAIRPILFHISGPVVRESADCLLIGWDATLYKNFLKRLYRPNVLATQGIAVALQLLLMAKNSCMWIGGPSRLIVMTANGPIQESPEDVAAIEERLARVSKHNEEIVSMAPDPTVHPKVLMNKLTEFREAILDLHAEYFRIEGRKMIQQKDGYRQGYQRLPFGSLLAEGLNEMEGAYALMIPDVPAKSNEFVCVDPDEFRKNPGKYPGTEFSALPLNDEWKTLRTPFERSGPNAAEEAIASTDPTRPLIRMHKAVKPPE